MGSDGRNCGGNTAVVPLQITIILVEEYSLQGRITKVLEKYLNYCVKFTHAKYITDAFIQF